MAHFIKFFRYRPDTDGVSSTANQNAFRGIHIYIFPTGIGSSRSSVFRHGIMDIGGYVDDYVTRDTTHIIIDEKITIDKLCEAFHWREPPPHVKLVQALWLTNCIKARACLSTEDYEVRVTRVCSPGDPKRRVVMSADISSTAGTSHNNCTRELNQISYPFVEPPKYVINFNKLITDKLSLIAETYRSTDGHWKALNYGKAIALLKSYPKSIKTVEEAKEIVGIEEKVLDSIVEVIDGDNYIVDEMATDIKSLSIRMFAKVLGINTTTAQIFVQQGLYTLDDLMIHAKVNRMQEIGIKYYDELLEKIPRSEATEIIDRVQSAIETLLPGAIVEPCGSYRRNHAVCGDVDLIVTHTYDELLEKLLPKIANILHEIGILTDNIMTAEEANSQNKFMGICKLPGEHNKHRKLDIFLIPFSEYACSMLHFTGSDEYNRGMEAVAAKKNMSLSEHGLRIQMFGSDLPYGYISSTPTEKSIFQALGLPYQPPHERDHFIFE